MQIDLPEVVAEVRAAFERYELALVTNDVATLDEMLRNDPRTIRYGATENLYGYKEIESFRAVRPSAGLARTLSKTVITAFRPRFCDGIHSIPPFYGPGKVGRMTQTWVRFDEGWRIVVGHVSVINE